MGEGSRVRTESQCPEWGRERTVRFRGYRAESGPLRLAKRGLLCAAISKPMRGQQEQSSELGSTAQQALAAGQGKGRSHPHSTLYAEAREAERFIRTAI